jgi:hypothetical protein
VPPDPLHGYQVLEVTMAPDSPAAGRPLGSIPWPAGSIPVSVLRDRCLTDPEPGLTLTAGDRVSLLTPAPGATASLPLAEPDAAPDGHAAPEAPAGRQAPGQPDRGSPDSLRSDR